MDLNNAPRVVTASETSIALMAEEPNSSDLNIGWNFCDAMTAHLKRWPGRWAEALEVKYHHITGTCWAPHICSAPTQDQHMLGHTSVQLLHRTGKCWAPHICSQLLHQLCSSSLLLGLSPSAPSMELNSKTSFLLPYPTQLVHEWVNLWRACTHTHIWPVTLHHCFLWCLSPSYVQFACLLLSSTQHFKEGRSFASFSFTVNN